MEKIEEGAGSAATSGCILADMQTPAGPAAVLATPGPGTSEAADAANHTEDVAPIAGDTADTTENAEPLAGPATATESPESPDTAEQNAALGTDGVGGRTAAETADGTSMPHDDTGAPM